MPGAISGFHRKVPENCTLLAYVYYTASSGNSLPTFRASYRSHPLQVSWILRMAPIGCPETSKSIYHYWLRNKPEELNSEMPRSKPSLVQIIASCLPLVSILSLYVGTQKIKGIYKECEVGNCILYMIFLFRFRNELLPVKTFFTGAFLHWVWN
jgi:hypothetical protein